MVWLLAACSSAEPKAQVVAEPTADPPPTQLGTSVSTCAADGMPGRHTRQVDGAHRACQTHADCVTVVTGCSNTECTGAHRDFAPRYPDDIDCTGYTGSVANYDCRPRFDIEAPRCREGCCVSERLRPVEGTVVGHPAGERLEIEAGTSATTSTGLTVYEDAG